MPEGIDNEKLWEKAKELYKKNYKREPDNERDFSYVMSIYLKLGGKTSKEFIQMVEKLIKGERMNLTEKINKLKQKVFLKESHMQVGDVSELNGVKVKVTKVLDNGYEVEEIIEESFKELSSNVSYWISDEYEFKGKKG
ncbi:MAG: hypothetical protein EOL97_09500, partial [Spirochaetia bacterium]|nr:hypothetical protein [Spirochaetia bacterium]